LEHHLDTECDYEKVETICKTTIPRKSYKLHVGPCKQCLSASSKLPSNTYQLQQYSCLNEGCFKKFGGDDELVSHLSVCERSECIPRRRHVADVGGFGRAAVAAAQLNRDKPAAAQLNRDRKAFYLRSSLNTILRAFLVFFHLIFTLAFKILVPRSRRHFSLLLVAVYFWGPWGLFKASFTWIGSLIYHVSFLVGSHISYM
jgi:hypothetical protein